MNFIHLGYVLWILITLVEAKMRIRSTGIRGYKNNFRYIPKSKIEFTKVLKRVRNSTVSMAGECLSYFSNEFESAICFDEIENQCLVLPETILFAMPPETRQDGDIRCFISETKPYFYANIPAPTIVSERINWRGKGNPFEEVFDGAFFYDAGYENTLQRAWGGSVSWYCMDLGPHFTPPATIVIYGVNRPHDYFLSDTPPINNRLTNTLTGKFPTPALETIQGMQVQRVFVDASHAGKRYFSIGTLTVNIMYVGLINIEPQ